MSGDALAEIDPDEIRGPLRAIYADLDAEIAALAPVCQVSGRCCRFKEYDHTLFLSAIEARLLIADAPEPSGTLDGGDTCPWQDSAGRCGAREARPLGCRVYFCDPNYEGEAEPLTERYLARLRGLADALGLPWGYARLHHHLHSASTAGLRRFEEGGTDRPGEDPGPSNQAEGREVLDISLSGQ